MLWANYLKIIYRMKTTSNPYSDLILKCSSMNLIILLFYVDAHLKLKSVVKIF